MRYYSDFWKSEAGTPAADKYIIDKPMDSIEVGDLFQYVARDEEYSNGEFEFNGLYQVVSVDGDQLKAKWTRGGDPKTESFSIQEDLVFSPTGNSYGEILNRAAVEKDFPNEFNNYTPQQEVPAELKTYHVRITNEATKEMLVDEYVQCQDRNEASMKAKDLMGALVQPVKLQCGYGAGEIVVREGHRAADLNVKVWPVKGPVQNKETVDKAPQQATPPETVKPAPPVEVEKKPTESKIKQNMTKKERTAMYRKSMADNFCKLLEKEHGQWMKEWIGAMPENPKSYATGKDYRGCNMFYLSMVQAVEGYKDPRWITRSTVFSKDNDFQVKKGSQLHYVEYWFMMKDGKELTWEEFHKLLDDVSDGIIDQSELEKCRYSARYFPVFNCQDVIGIEPYQAPDPKILNADNHQNEKINQMIETMGVTLEHNNGNKCYYRPSADKIVMPHPEQFQTQDAYQFAILHESVHATGAPQRLNRHDEYAHEELVAEIGACMMAAQFGVKDVDPHQIENAENYVASWMKHIKDDPDALVKAVKQSMTASEYLDAALEDPEKMHKMEAKYGLPMPEKENQKDNDAR